MTEAYVPDKSEINCTQESTNTENANTTETNDNTASLESDTNCNITEDFTPPQNANLITLQIAANISSKSNANKDDNATEDCDENAKTISGDCLDKLSKINEIPKRDTVLKYVYNKNDDKSIVNQKPQGHPLNSLRKKRSLNLENKANNIITNQHLPLISKKEISEDEQKETSIAFLNKPENITTDASENTPLIVNFETAHTPKGREIEVDLPVFQRLTDNTIKNSALADFNIETLHEPKPKQLLKNAERLSDDSSSRSHEDSEESGENKNYNREKNRSYSDESSAEQVYPKRINRPNSNYRKSVSDESREREEYKKNSSSNENSGEVNDDDRDNNSRQSEEYYPESGEKGEREQYRRKSSKNEDSREVINNDKNISQKLKDTYEKYEHHPQKPKNNFERYDDNPRKTEGSFEKYDVKPGKNDGSFEKYEDKEYPPPSAAAYTKPHNDRNVVSSEQDSSRSVENSESKESHETNDSTEVDKSSYKKLKNDQKNSDHYKESDPKHQSLNNNYKDDSSQSSETSYENNNDNHPQNNKPNEEYKTKPQERENSISSPPKIQDVDLGDFSYERIQVNDKGHIVPTVESDETDTSTLSKPILQLNTDEKNQKTSIPTSDIDEHLKSEIYESIKQPIRINGEIKPVVEINSEIHEGETSDESTNDSLKNNPENNLSLESIIGTNQNDQSEKIVDQKKTAENEDVKQQFERIPKDYKHEDKKEENTGHSQETQKETPSEGNEEQVKIEGTLDTLSPKDENYDEHLKFKFDDISIKLPNINLPDDVLSYAYEEPSYDINKNKYEKQKNKPKEKFFHYSDEYAEDNPRENKNDDKHDDDSDNEHNYYGYYGPSHEKQDLRKKTDDEEDEEDEEDVDLYEKFVRERFGKQGSFEKRSEKLQEARSLPYVSNPKLYQTVQNILKQTSQIDQQAKKSGDPNAGYMWTLEYGENL